MALPKILLYQACLFENDLADRTKPEGKQCTAYRAKYHVDYGRTEGRDHRDHHKQKHTASERAAPCRLAYVAFL